MIRLSVLVKETAPFTYSTLNDYSSLKATTIIIIKKQNRYKNKKKKTKVAEGMKSCKVRKRPVSQWDLRKCHREEEMNTESIE